MAVVQTVDAMEVLRQERSRASEPRVSSYASTFLIIKPNQKALVRPLVNFNQMTPLKMHHKYNEANAKLSVNALCAAEIGEPCAHCAAAVDDFKLKAGMNFFLPSYLHLMRHTQADARLGIKANDPVTYKQGDDALPVKGVRLIELSLYGIISLVLNELEEYYQSSPSHDIRSCDFVISRPSSAGGKSSYNVKDQPPSVFNLVQQGMTITPDMYADVREMVWLACPPAIVGGVSPAAPATSAPAQAPAAQEEGIPLF